MANNVVVQYGGDSSNAATSARYLSAYGDSAESSSPSGHKWVVPIAMTLKEFFYFSRQNLRVGGTFTVSVNGDANLKVSQAAETNGVFSETGETLALSAGDFIYFRMSADGGTGTCHHTSFSVIGEVDTSDDLVVFGQGDEELVNAGATEYIGVNSLNPGDASDIYPLPVPAAMDIKNLYVYTRTNDLAGGNGEVVVMKDGSPTLLKVTITAGGGLATYSETGVEVSFAAGDEISFKLDASGASSGAMNVTSIACVGVLT